MMALTAIGGEGQSRVLVTCALVCDASLFFAVLLLLLLLFVSL